MAPTVIKKYGNRRLYDTGDSKYVTLDELATKIRSGVDVRVIGAEGGEDLTQATLTQIVLETGNAAKFLPTQLLMQMIRLSDDSLAEFFSRYVTSALDIYLGAKRGVQSLSGLNPLTWMGGMGGFSPFPGYPQQGGYPQPSPSFVPAPPPPPEEAPPERKSERGMNGNGADEKNDVGAMRRELDELKQMIRDGLGGGAKKKRKRTDTDE